MSSILSGARNSGSWVPFLWVCRQEPGERERGAVCSAASDTRQGWYEGFPGKEGGRKVERNEGRRGPAVPLEERALNS